VSTSAVAEPEPVPSTRPASLVFNTIVMTASSAVSFVINTALAIYAIRTFSVEEYGHFAIALALIGIFGVFSETGISTTALRSMSTDHAGEANHLGVALVAEFVTSLVVAPLMLPVGFLLGYPPEVIALLGIGAMYLFFQGFLAALDATFRARRVLVFPALLLALQAVVTAAAGAVLISSGSGPPGLVTAMGLGYAAAGVAAFVLVRSRLKIPIVLTGTVRKVPSFLRTALPIAATGGIAIVYERIDLLMVSKLDSTAAAAIYGVVLTALAVSAILPSIIAPAFFPLLAAGLKEAREQARESFFLLWRVFLLLSVPVALFLVFGSDDLVTVVLGDRYQGAGTPLAIVGGCIVLGFLNYLLWYALLAAYRERRRLVLLAVSLAVNIGLNVVLIPPYGPTGAAAALVVSDVLIVGWQTGMVHRSVFAVPFRRLFLRPVVAVLAALAVATPLSAVATLGAAVAAPCIYAALLLLVGYVTREEWRPLIDPLRSFASRRTLRAGAG
jgi:O-antigen/teichoic acid export membrane protein